MKIQITASPSEISARTFTVDIADLGFTEMDWNRLGYVGREEAIQKYLDGLTEQPYWSFDSYNIKT